jgi:hypothetical protein
LYSRELRWLFELGDGVTMERDLEGADVGFSDAEGEVGRLNYYNHFHSNALSQK